MHLEPTICLTKHDAQDPSLVNEYAMIPTQPVINAEKPASSLNGFARRFIRASEWMSSLGWSVTMGWGLSASVML